MDNHLRAPDPTLTANAGRIVYVRGGIAVTVAHLSTQEGRDCAGSTAIPVLAEWARWFSVPCPECFPEAPRPGFSEDRRTGDWGLGPGPDRGLAWQVSA